MRDLPAGWAEVEIVEVLEPNENGKPFQQGWSPQCENFAAPQGRWGVLKTTAIQHGEFWAHENKALPASMEPRPQIEVKAGDLLMTCAGPRNRCGVACLVEHTPPRLMMSGKMYRFRPRPEALLPKYLAYLIQGRESQLAIDRMKTGISDSGLNLTHDRFAQLRVPVAPLPEQRRIVAKIEELFSELDASAESLTRARAQLKTYRQALLKAAFEGKLTADWRAKNARENASPTEDQLSALKQARESWYKQEKDNTNARCAEWKNAGGKGPAPARPERFRQPAAVAADELARLPHLPAGWSYLRLSEIACVGSGMSVSKGRILEDPVEVPYLRVANVQRGHVDLSHIRTMMVERSQLASLALRKNDVLFNEGGDRDKLGRGWVWDGAIAPCITQNHVFRATLFRPNEAVAKLLSHWGNSEGRDYFDKGGKQTTNLASINKAVLSALPVPLIPDAEADLLYARLEAAFSTLDKNLSEVDAALSAIGALRQSVLKRAFSGKLIPQDPSDEPAAALLARLREAPDAAPRRTRRKQFA